MITYYLENLETHQELQFDDWAHAEAEYKKHVDRQHPEDKNKWFLYSHIS